MSRLSEHTWRIKFKHTFPVMQQTNVAIEWVSHRIWEVPDSNLDSATDHVD